MNLHLSQQDGVPIYLQIMNQIKHLIAAKRLLPGTELTPIRVLAETLVVNPNTVARAYRELETQGWVYKRRGAGTFVSEQHVEPLDPRTNRQIKDRIQALLIEAKHMNISTQQIIAYIEELSDLDNRDGDAIDLSRD